MFFIMLKFRANKNKLCKSLSIFIKSNFEFSLPEKKYIFAAQILKNVY